MRTEAAPGRRLALTAPPARAQPRAAQLLHAVDVDLVGRVTARAGTLEKRRQALEARLRQERGAAAGAELALAGDGVPVAVGPERRLGVVHVQAPQPALADHLVAAVHPLRELVRCRDVEARGEQVAGVEAEAEAVVATAQRDQRRELLEGPPERVAGAGGVLEQQRAGLGLGQGMAHHLTHARQGLLVR